MNSNPERCCEKCDTSEISFVKCGNKDCSCHQPPVASGGERCLIPPKSEGVLLSNPPQYRCARGRCPNTWVVGTEPPICTEQKEAAPQLPPQKEVSAGWREKWEEQSFVRVMKKASDFRVVQYDLIMKLLDPFISSLLLKQKEEMCGRLEKKKELFLEAAHGTTETSLYAKAVLTTLDEAIKAIRT